MGMITVAKRTYAFYADLIPTYVKDFQAVIFSKTFEDKLGSLCS